MKSIVEFIRAIRSLSPEQKEVLEANRKQLSDIVTVGNAQELLFILNELYHKACIQQIIDNELEESDIPLLISTLDSTEVYVTETRSWNTIYDEFKLSGEVLCKQLQNTYFRILVGDELSERCTKLIKAHTTAVISCLSSQLQRTVKSNEIAGKNTLKEIDICYRLIGNVATKVITNKCNLVNTLRDSNIFERLKNIDMATVLGILQNNSIKEEREAEKQRSKQLLASN